MKVSMLLLAIIVVSALVPGCKPKQSDNISGGGKGGNATLVARADHVNTIIDTAVAFIKYGAKNAPENGIYDDSVKMDKKGNGIFSNLTTGNYYILVQGIHNPYNPNTVTGGGRWVIATATAVDTFTIGTAEQNFTYPPWGL